MENGEELVRGRLGCRKGLHVAFALTRALQRAQSAEGRRKGAVPSTKRASSGPHARPDKGPLGPTRREIAARQIPMLADYKKRARVHISKSECATLIAFQGSRKAVSVGGRDLASAVPRLRALKGTRDGRSQPAAATCAAQLDCAPRRGRSARALVRPFRVPTQASEEEGGAAENALNASREVEAQARLDI